ncbi:MAG: plasmid stabilization protein [Syntrophobacteraceae bacterium]|jgi:mRNA-degrading endonuclease YafQ of YafQ-DinJ toxin-antitoxin module
MKFRLIFPKSYNRRASKFFKKHPELIDIYEKVLRLLEANPHHPSLRLHPLSGKLSGLHAVSITLSYRITLEMMVEEHEIILVNVGDHDTVHKT